MSKLVVKDNALINASYGLSLVEQRLILLSIVEARETNANADYDRSLIVTADKYAKHFNVTTNAAYDALKTACNDLLERRFSYQSTVNGKIVNHTSRWVSDVGYAVNGAFVTIRFAQAVIPLIPLIDELKRHFTSYELVQVASLNNGYSVRLYELLISWRKVGKVPPIELNELREKLGVLDSEYPLMERFKARVLLPALKQINQHTDITADYEQHKTGRTITAISFTFKPKKSAKTIAAPTDADTFIKLTDSQINLFSNKLAALPELGSDAPIGKSTADFAAIIADHLADENQQKQYHKYLPKVGYKVSKRKV